MKKEIVDTNTEFNKKVKSDLKSLGVQVTSNDLISFMVDNDSDDIVVDYNYMSTGLHYKKKDIKEDEVINAGFKWQATWNFYEK